MKLNAVTKLLNTTPRTIKYYEELGLISPSRTNSNYREYSQKDVELLEKILQYREMGISLENIKKMINSSSIEENIAYYELTENSIDEEILALERKKLLLEQMKFFHRLYLNNPNNTFMIHINDRFREVETTDTISHHLFYYVNGIKKILIWDKHGDIHIDANAKCSFDDSNKKEGFGNHYIIYPFFESKEITISLIVDFSK